MTKTTIEITTDLRDRLREERLSHESNYAETIARLLDGGDGGQLRTDAEVREIAETVVAERVVPEAQR